MNQDKACTIAIRLARHERLALEVRVRGHDVYVKYFSPDGAEHTHTSYHASGQLHTKINGNYGLWTGGPSGRWEPMKQYRPPPASIEGREEFSVIGWGIGDILAVLPQALGRSAQMVVDATDLPPSSLLAFKFSVVGSESSDRAEILGFPVLQRKRLTANVDVEIEAFLVNDPA